MLALIRMDWTLNRRMLLRLSPLLLLWCLAALQDKGNVRALLLVFFLTAEILMLAPLFQNLIRPVEDFVCALPVTRARIVCARYLSALLALCVAFLVTGALGWAGHLGILKIVQGSDPADFLPAACLQALLLASLVFLYLPFHFRFGGDRGLGLFLVSLLGAPLALLILFGWHAVLDHAWALGSQLLEEGRGWALLSGAALGGVSLAASIRAFRGRVGPRPLPAFVPGLLLAATFAGLALAARVTVARADSARIRTELESLLVPRAKGGRPGYALLVTRQGEPLLRKAVGLADVATGRPIDLGEPFPVASLTKQFTAALVLRLAEEGRIELARPIRAYVPEVPEAWGRVTVDQCLHHTGGIPEFTQAPGFEEGEGRDLRPAQVLAAYLQGRPLDFEPGTAFRYSNTGYLLLGMALERISGRPYGELVRDRICRPLHLDHTSCRLAPDSPLGYTEGGKPARAPWLVQAHAAGGLVSTVEDLTRWSLALVGGKVLKASSLALMTTPGRTSDGKATSYGCGLLVTDLQGRRILSHGGRLDGFTSVLLVDPARKVVVALLCNSDQGSGLPMNRILDIASGMPRPDLEPVPQPAAVLDALAGTYVFKPGLSLEVRRNGRRLMATPTGQEAVELLPLGRTRFFLKGDQMELEFRQDARGAAESLVVDPEGRAVTGHRVP